jgi:hypothetical protein
MIRNNARKSAKKEDRSSDALTASPVRRVSGRFLKSVCNATCNPDADSWVANFLAWWIDPEGGLPIPERAGVLRYFVRIAEKILWADRPEELM